MLLNILLSNTIDDALAVGFMSRWNTGLYWVSSSSTVQVYACERSDNRKLGDATTSNSRGRTKTPAQHTEKPFSKSSAVSGEAWATAKNRIPALGWKDVRRCQILLRNKARLIFNNAARDSVQRPNGNNMKPFFFRSRDLTRRAGNFPPFPKNSVGLSKNAPGYVNLYFISWPWSRWQRAGFDQC